MPSVLQSDRLESKYGLMHAKVEKHDSRMREVFLVDAKGVAREYALTFFPDKPSKSLAKMNGEIKHGGLIGKTFRKHNYIIQKKKQIALEIKIPAWLKKKFGTKKQTAKAKIYEFWVKKGKQPLTLYGIIFETYNPD